VAAEKPVQVAAAVPAKAEAAPARGAEKKRRK
jgi:hypothetical protein